MRRAFRIIAALAFLIGLWSHAHAEQASSTRESFSNFYSYKSVGSLAKAEGGRSIKFAQLPMTGAGKGAPGGGPPPSTTTWNPADIGPGLSLSGSDLTVTQSAAAFDGVRSIASHSTGAYYWEDTLVVVISAGLGGIGNSSSPLTSFVGQDNNGIGYYAAGTIFLNGGSAASVQTAVQGDVVGYAVHMGNQKFWARTIHLGVAGNWNNSGTDDPATNTGGVSFATMAAGPYFAIATLNGNTGQVTTNFGALPFAAAAPSGFGNW